MAVLTKVVEADPDTVGEDDRFAEDLHADSLALVELVDMLEEELSERTVGFEFDDEDLVELCTVRDAVVSIMAKIGD